MDNTNLINLLYQTNPWWEDKKFTFKLKERPEYLTPILERRNNLINILIGARRVGKTFILKSIINKLLLNNIAISNILYISCDAIEIKENGIKKIIDIYMNKFGLKINDIIYVFLDEIQEIPNWQSDVKYFYDNLNIKFYLTGSSSLILSNQTSKLTGRFILQHILPLSFNEYLLFTKQTLLKTDKYNNKILEKYLQTGGYPEYVLFNDKGYLMDAVESTLYRELLGVYGIRNPILLRNLLEYLSDKITNYVSANKIRQDLKIDDRTAKFYLQYLQDIYLIFPVYKEGKSYRISRGSVPKYYFSDTGILNMFSLNPKIGQLAENAVFLHLMRKEKNKQFNLIFYENINNIEVDFKLDNRIYEVKFRDGTMDEDLIKYQVIDDKITFIVKENYSKFHNILPQHEQIKLYEFLSN